MTYEYNLDLTHREERYFRTDDPSIDGVQDLLYRAAAYLDRQRGNPFIDSIVYNSDGRDFASLIVALER